MSNGRVISRELERISWKQLWSCMRFHSRIKWEELWMTMKKLRQIVCVAADSWIGHLLNTSQKYYCLSQFPHFHPKFFALSTWQFTIPPWVRLQPGHLSLDWLMCNKLKRCGCLPTWHSIHSQRDRLPWIVQSWCQPIIFNRRWNWSWHCSHWYITNYTKGLLTCMVHTQHLLTFQSLFWALFHHLCLFQTR